MDKYICQMCHKVHDGKYGSGRFCCQICSNKSRKQKRRATINNKKKNAVNPKAFNPTVSKLQTNVSKTLTKHGIIHQTQFKVGKYWFDIRIGNKLFQINGTYWHFDPRVYQPNQLVKMPGNKKMLVSTKWKKDLKKKLEALKRGYMVFYLWQKDITIMTESEIVLFFKKRLFD